MPSPYSSQYRALFTFILSLCLLTPSYSWAFPSRSTDDDSVPYPVIGLFTQPSPYTNEGFPSTEFSYIAASYVKHLESAGATVVPIQWDLPTDELDTLLGKLNGVLFPGGGTTLVLHKQSPSLFQQAGMYIVQKALEFNNNGDYFPIWGTCLGYELLVLAISTNWTSLIDIVDGEDVAKPLNLTQNGINGLYAGMDSNLTNDIATANLSYFHHKHTPDPAGFTNDTNLASNFTVAAWTQDSVAGPYAALIQGTAHPFFGTQFHPEKNTYEWESTTQIPHSLQAVYAQEYYAYYFVNQTLQNKHRFDSVDDLQQYWIYNYQPKHFGPDPEFEQLYLFENVETYSPDVPLIDEYPAGERPAAQRENDKSSIEVPEFDEVFRFKEVAPFLFN